MNSRLLTLAVFVALFASGCAGSTARKSVDDNQEVASITVENLFGKGISVYYREPLNPYLYLGYIPVGEKRTFQVKGPFYETRFTLIAKPTIGTPFYVNIPVGLKAGKEIYWAAEHRHFAKLEMSEPATE